LGVAAGIGLGAALGLEALDRKGMAGSVEAGRHSFTGCVANLMLMHQQINRMIFSS
jgi:hypothetical protein